ncbi:MAG: hypothetical protein ABR507_05955 [Actinomycetota bacterium]|nr:hypothetical protein [Actinomycetota bacterium]
MAFRRFRIGLAAYCAVIALGTGAMVIAGYRLPSVQAKREANSIKAQLNDRSSHLKTLQDTWQKHRVIIRDYFVSLEDVLKLARVADGSGIDQARTKFAGIGEIRKKAEATVNVLPRDTLKIITEARQDLALVSRLRVLVRSSADSAFLVALHRSLQTFIDSFVLFGKMNEPISRGVVMYTELFDKTDAFLKAQAQGQFRTKPEASKSYSVSTTDVSTRITQLTAELAARQTQAAQKLAESSVESQKATRLRPR